jgi:GNAT superfamily N-acetyltransferase
MTEQLIIRKASIEDLPSVLNLYGQKDLDNGNILAVDEANLIFNKFSTYPNFSLYVAILEDIVVGTFELLIMDNLGHKGSPSGIIEDVVVDENYRSKGIGARMMEHALHVCQGHNCYKLTLSSNLKRERAHQFYEKLGFKKHGYSFLMELL